MLDDALEDEGGHGGVDDVVGDAALGQPRLLILARVDGVSELRRVETDRSGKLLYNIPALSWE